MQLKCRGGYGWYQNNPNSADRMSSFDLICVKQFIQMSWVPEIPTENFCLDCWRNHSYMGPPCTVT